MMMTTSTADHVKMESPFYHEEEMTLPDFTHISAGYAMVAPGRGNHPGVRYPEQKLMSGNLHGHLKKKSGAAAALAAALVVPPPLPGTMHFSEVITRNHSALKLLSGQGAHLAAGARGGGNASPVITVAGISVGPPSSSSSSSSNSSPEASLLPTASQPTLSLLKLASPELEHLIIQANPELLAAAADPAAAAATAGGGGSPSSPPPALPGPQQQQQQPFLYRSPATAAIITQEQEGFADGFVKALADLHKQNQLLGSALPPPAASLQQVVQQQGAGGGSGYPRSLHPSGELPVYTNLSSFNPVSGPPLSPPGGGYSGAGGIPFPALQGLPLRLQPQAHRGGPGLDEPQTVPEGAPGPPGGVDPCGSPPSLSPMDPETQERIKAERKRLRNRIAASKCRKRKLERIARLEEKVKVLKSQNSDLASTASLLREQVSQLKQKVLSHATSGCQIAVTKGSPPGTAAEGASC